MGKNAIEKANDFCNKFLNIPDQIVYKALFQTIIVNLENGICNVKECPSVEHIFNEENSVYGAWTGISDAKSFSTNGNNCEGWAISGNELGHPFYGGSHGIGNKKNEKAFTNNGFSDCRSPFSLYCVEQP